MKLNYDKLQYKQIEVHFFSKTYTTNGCKPASNKVQTITNMLQPANK